MAWGNDQIRDRVIRTLIGEGAHNDPDSWASVAHVLKNRVDSGQYGNPNGGLTNAITAHNPAGTYQFSMWSPSISSSGKTISPSDPLYQRAGVIADQVFSDQHPDNTGGADHYYAPSGMPGGRAPSWAIGQTPTATIGGQHFYKLGLSASDAINQGHTSAPAIGTPTAPAAPAAAPLGTSNAAPARDAVNAALADAKSMLGKNEVPNHDELQQYLHDGGQDLDPHKLAWCAAFVSASLQKAGLPVPTQVVKDSAFGGGALAGDYKTYGSAVDPVNTQAGDILVANDGSHVGFAEGPVRQGPNGPEVQMIAGNEKDTSGQYTPGSYTNPTTGAVANRAQVGMVGERWVPLSQYTVRRYTPTNDAAGPASSAAPAAAATAAVPAAQAQPVSASAPAGASAIPGPAASPSAGFVGPGSDKYSVVSGMTTGTSHNPQLTTAANWGNLFGGAAPSAPPAATPAVAPATAKPPPGKLDTSYGPQLPTPPLPPGAPPASAAPGSPLSSVVTNWGSSAAYDPTPTASNPDPTATARIPKATPGTPSMGFPAMTNPFGQPPPDQQTSMLPGSMLTSAQDLIRRLFPSSVG